MFGNQDKFVGPMSLEDQETDLRKNKILAALLQKNAQQSSQNFAPDSTSGALNIANSLIGGLGAAYLMNKNDQNENILKKNRAMAGLLAGGSNV